MLALRKSKVRNEPQPAEPSETKTSANMYIAEINSTRSLFPNLAEAWRYRTLALTLAYRNVRIKYTQTIMGSAWAIIHPVLFTGLLTVVFGLLLSVPSDGMPYALFVFTGTTIWTVVNRTLSDTATSLAGSSGIILKVYFPRILIPISSALTAIVDAFPIYLLLLVCVIGSGHFPGWPVLLSPLFLLLAVILAFAIGLALTGIDAVIRDVRLLLPAAMQLVFYITPVLYAQSVIPERWRQIYRLNPFLGLINGFRWATIADAPLPDVLDLAWTFSFTGIILLVGLLLFSRLENFAVDRI